MSPPDTDKPKDEPSSTPLRQAPPLTYATTRAFAFQLPSSGGGKGKGKEAVPATKPALSSIGSFSPFNVSATKPPHPHQHVTPVRSTSVSSRLTTPGPSGNSVASGSRPLQPLSATAHFGSSKPEALSEETNGKRKWAPLGTALAQEVLQAARVQGLAAEVKEEEDVGIGVSPRKLKKWRRGPVPPSKRLEDLLSAQKTSLVLFYTSLASQSHPKITSKRNRGAHLGDRGEGDYGEGVTKAMTRGVQPTAQVRTAPVCLRLEETLQAGGQGAGKMFRCRILHSPSAEGNEQQPISRRKRSHASVKVEEEENDLPHRLELENHEDEEVAFVVLGLPPATVSIPGWDVREVSRRLAHGSDSQSLGTQPRAIQNKVWEVGLWEPWTETTIQAPHDGVTVDERKTPNAERVSPGSPTDSGDTGPERAQTADHSASTRRIRVFFASRYLIAVAE